MALIEIYTRAHCHLCDVAKEIVAPIAAAEGVDVALVDVDSDPELARSYGQQVPVVFIGGRKAFKYHVDDKHRLQRLIQKARGGSK